MAHGLTARRNERASEGQSMKNIVIAVAVAVVTFAAAAASQAQGKPQGALSGPEIKTYFSGQRIYGTTPSGKTWLIDFNADGSFRGAVPKGEDTGRWWVERDTLCRKWTAWENQNIGHSKKQACFWIVLDRRGRRVNYVNMDGSLYRSWRMSN
jgi:hypothetical protein